MIESSVLTNVEKVEFFLGIVNFYEKVVEKCFEITAPLTELIKKT